MSLHVVVQPQEAANKPEVILTLAPLKEPGRPDQALAYGRNPTEPYAYADTMAELLPWLKAYAEAVDRRTAESDTGAD